MPTNDMPVRVRDGREMKALSDKGAITIRRWGELQRGVEGILT